MVRLTAQLINMSAQKHNPIRDWELDLRGYRIPVIENLGATLDQFDTIDMTDNDIRKLDKFPLLKRLKNVLLSNNRIVRIADDIHENLPNLETLILTNNSLRELADLDPLSTITSLKNLSLLGNPVAARKNYRLYVINKIPSLKVLDFSRIKQKERETANKIFKKKKPQLPVSTATTKTPSQNGIKEKTFTPGENLPTPRVASTGRSKEEVDAIKKAITNSKTLEEVERLRQMLMTGHVPGESLPPPQNKRKAESKDEESEEEMDEEEEAAVPKASGVYGDMEKMEDD